MSTARKSVMAVVAIVTMILAVTAQAPPTTAREVKTTKHHPTPKPKPKVLKCAKRHAYHGHQSSDCVAVNNVVAIANTTVTATWSKSTNILGSSICAAVTVKNHNSSTITYNDLYWTLQTPSGEVVNANFEGSPDLGSGSIIGGGSASGNVCFDDPGQTGTYVGIYKPDPFNSDRGIWLFPGT
jgi:Domain of unknown function (DUF4352)